MHLTTRLVRHPLGLNVTVFVNTLSGAIDLFTDEQVRAIDRLATDGESGAPAALVAHLERRGYLFPSAAAEERCFVELRERIRALETREPPVFGVCVTYTCFFACRYCYEGDLTRPPRRASVTAEDVLNGMRRLEQLLPTTTTRASRPAVTLLGGEPLQPSVRDFVLPVLADAARRGYRIRILTNGFFLDTFIEPLLDAADAMAYVQVTLDGPPAVHDVRRPLRGGGGSFARVVANVDRALEAGLSLRLRTNVDTANLEALPALAEVIRTRGWNSHPHFRAYLAPTEDCTCQGLSGLVREDELLRGWEELCERPGMGEGLGVFDDAMLYRVTAGLKAAMRGRPGTIVPRFTYCSATKGKAYVFGPDGLIYQCLRGVGDARTSVGAYAPEFRLDADRVRRWTTRDITTIGCSSCASVATLHGGGCSLEALHRHGDLQACSCGDTVSIVKGYLERHKALILSRWSTAARGEPLTAGRGVSK